jgi:hypothetical protein
VPPAALSTLDVEATGGAVVEAFAPLAERKEEEAGAGMFFRVRGSILGAIVEPKNSQVR